jgi:hypothetical protein
MLKATSAAVDAQAILEMAGSSCQANSENAPATGLLQPFQTMDSVDSPAIRKNQPAATAITTSILTNVWDSALRAGRNAGEQGDWVTRSL